MYNVWEYVHVCSTLEKKLLEGKVIGNSLSKGNINPLYGIQCWGRTLKLLR